MNPGRRLDTVLFLQKPEILPGQRDQVAGALAAAFPGARLTACGGPEEVPSGADFDAVIAPTLPWLPEALGRLARYDWIHFLSAGVDRIWDMPLRREGVLLTKSSGVHAGPMSEFALGAMLYFAKSFDRFAAQSRHGEWQRAWLDELAGRTVTILGMGHVGGAVARRAAAFGMRVLGVQRSPRALEGVERTLAPEQLDEVLPQTAYLVVSLPLTPATVGRVDERVLGLLPPGAVLVDISRGGVVRESAVLAALDSGRLRGAALDVFEQEPLPPGSRLWGHPRVLLTPHVAGTNPRYMERAMAVFIANARRWLAGEPAETPVDPGRGY